MEVKLAFSFPSAALDVRPKIEAKVETFCCAEMKKRWGDFVWVPKTYEREMRLAAYTTFRTAHYDGIDVEEIEVRFCPFCGQRIDLSYPTFAETVEECNRRGRLLHERKQKQVRAEKLAEFERLRVELGK